MSNGCPLFSVRQGALQPVEALAAVRKLKKPCEHSSFYSKKWYFTGLGLEVAGRL